jgi:hypothetical protein
VLDFGTVPATGNLDRRSRSDHKPAPRKAKAARSSVADVTAATNPLKSYRPQVKRILRPCTAQPHGAGRLPPAQSALKSRHQKAGSNALQNNDALQSTINAKHNEDGDDRRQATTVSRLRML